jgi:uncharacterized membrane protein
LNILKVVGPLLVGMMAHISTGQTVTPLLPLTSGDGSYAQSINSSGDVVGYSTGSSEFNLPTLWRSGPVLNYAAEPMPLLPSMPSAVPNSIGNGGIIAGYAQPADLSTATAVLWTASSPGGAYGISALPMPAGAVLTDAYAVNASGLVAGYATDASSTTTAIIWNPSMNGAYSAAYALPTFTNQIESAATAVNSDGDVAGYMIDADGNLNAAPHSGRWPDA